MIEVPPAVAAKAREVGASAWLADLPSLVAGLAKDWQLALGSPYPDATEAYVAPAKLADGTAAVLKVLIPRSFEDADHEIEVLRLADGDGCAQLFRSDEQRRALLLERLGPSLYTLGLPIAQRHGILCDVARRV